MNTIIFFVLVILFVNVYYGMKRGFVKSMLPLLTNLITIILLSCTRSVWGSVLTKWVLADSSLFIVRIVVLVLIYLIVVSLMKLLIVSLRIITKLPVLHFFDKIFGLFTGAAIGMLWIWSFLAIVYILKDTAFGSWALVQIQENATIQFLYQHNLITYIVAEFV